MSNSRSFSESSGAPERPLAGLRVLELGGIGPVQFAGMFLGELGADVVRIDRPRFGPATPIDPNPRNNLLNRGKRSIVLDLKARTTVELVRSRMVSTDVLIEGFRPGVTERLSLGPDDCRAINPRLVYGRVTGWGQNGPLAARAGHDLNYIALSGVVDSVGEADGSPQFPLSVLGDFGAGGNYLVIGILAALQQVSRTGRGDVVDAAILDATLHLLTATHALMNDGSWVGRRKHNVVDGGAPFYGVYRTADDRYLAVCAIESQFYEAFLGVIGLSELLEHQLERERWPRDRMRIAAVVATRLQAEWLEAFADIDACVSPVLGLREAAGHPQIRARDALFADDIVQAGFAPKFAEAAPTTRVPGPPPAPGEHTREVLSEWGVTNVDDFAGAQA